MNIRDIFTRPIAHRGLHSKNCPENTLEAFQEAIKYNFPIELDVQLLRDGNIIVYHDDNTKRLCYEEKIVNNLSLNEISQLQIFNKFKIPTFLEVLKLVNEKVPILIEIKNSSTKQFDLEQKLINILDNYHGSFAIQSFNPLSLLYIKKQKPEYFLGMLSCLYKEEKNLSIFKKFLLKNMVYFNKINPQFISYKYTDLPNETVNKCVSKNNAAIFAWTVRNVIDYETTLKYSDNIIFESFIPND